jgi:glycosyltransferase involved in cell wall biosynthesis
MNVTVTRVSVIATVFNERTNIDRLIESLAAQTRRPDEVILCDGGSTDGTVDAIRAFATRYPDRLPNLRVVEAPGANISRGRNIAIAAAAGPLIATTDAGVRLEPQWLEALVAPWAADDRTLAVAGAFVPDAQGIFQTAMAATVLPLVEEIDPQRFLPSSRSVAFTKTAWERAGGYPEWLDYCEDLLFDFAINAQAPGEPTGFVWAPDACVHFRPRESLRDFWTQYYRYARGDGKADLWRKRHAIRYATYFVALPMLLGHAFFGFFARWLGWIGLIFGVFLYCRRPWQRLRVLGASLSPVQWLAAAALVPVIRVTGDLAKMAGYPAGLWWRWQRRGEIPDWKRSLEK